MNEPDGPEAREAAMDEWAAEDEELAELDELEDDPCWY
jgi:hypothetical protein